MKSDVAGFLREEPVALFAHGSTNRRRKKLNAAVHITWEQGESDSSSDIQEVVASIWHQNSPERIGYYHGHIIECSGMDMRSFFSLCDDHSQELCDFAAELSKSRFGLWRFTHNGGILFANMMEVLPAWRGQGTGAAVFRFMLGLAKLEFDASVCAFLPCPLQFERPSPRNPESWIAMESLRRYYVTNFGAKPLQPKSSYYYIRL